MTPMEAVAAEVAILITRHEQLGLRSALARDVGLTSSAINGWTRGAVPNEVSWAAIEGFFHLPAGHLHRIYAGEVAPDTEPSAVDLTGKQKPANGPRRRGEDVDLPDLVRTVHDLGTTVAALADEVDRLRKIVDAPEQPPAAQPLPPRQLAAAPTPKAKRPARKAPPS